MLSLKKGVKIWRILMTGKNSENSASFIIDKDNPEIGRNIIIPERITVIKKAKVTSYKNGWFFTNCCITYRSASTAIYSTGTSITEYL